LSLVGGVSPKTCWLWNVSLKLRISHSKSMNQSKTFKNHFPLLCAFSTSIIHHLGKNTTKLTIKFMSKYFFVFVESVTFDLVLSYQYFFFFNVECHVISHKLLMVPEYVKNFISIHKLELILTLQVFFY